MLEFDQWARLPFHFWSVVFLILGAVVGSFLNVCIHRLPEQKSLLSPPSHCPQCGARIPWYHNIPLLSWWILKGRCAQCQAPIPVRYFLVEAVTALLFLLAWLRFGPDSWALALIYSGVFSGLLVATLVDLEHFIIPDEITIGGIVAGFLASFAVPELHGTESRTAALQASFFGIVVGGGVIYAILQLGKIFFGRQNVRLPETSRIAFTEESLQLPHEEIPYEALFARQTDTIRLHGRKIELPDRCYPEADVSLSPQRLEIGDTRFNPEEVARLTLETDEVILPREAMGLGDVKFMAAIGAFLGWQGTLFALMVSSVIGALVGVGLIAMKRREWGSLIPYGPYIAVAAALWVFWGELWVNWWLNR